MTRSFCAALVIVALVPVAASATTIVAPGPTVPVDAFDLPTLMDDTDRVLSSVDGLPLSPTNPFASPDRAIQRSARVAATAGPADATAQEPLPEPATWLMMILGFFGLSFAVRRRSPATGTRVRFS